ncbi:tRNA pseudouridine synthase 1 [Onygenales sp. PD_40]|nr:tRNA pseudouridine synthase 1 [Onygenales sp. PD_40]KAK2770480.1 tRNA pseudouridine synthase 1 [Emmonsiellopsis sp. PD_33]KAK2791775.1 tRNA pseudouridine synthase 1 [Onygenales sp. PD_10]
MDTDQQPPNPTPAIDAVPTQPSVPDPSASKEQELPNDQSEQQGSKRKRDSNDNRGGRGGGRRNKGKDLGRKAWSRQTSDKRARVEGDQAAKRQKTERGEGSLPIYATEFSKEDIEADQRRPKRKVAVLLGYSGSGYHGMQLSATEKTIEGDLFTAFVAAGAISKANATDPKKSSLVRCARTDKGVHAAGNVVSLKLIIEDPDIVKKINDNLSPQIRVWGIEVCNKSFSSYHLCDSRIYEYLIPTHCFLPPHPSTHLGRKLVESAEQENDLEGYKQRQAEVASYWDEVDEKYIKPILETLPEIVRKRVEKALCIKSDTEPENDASAHPSAQDQPSQTQEAKSPENPPEVQEQPNEENPSKEGDAQRMSTNAAIRTIREAYLKAKRAYRIPKERMDRINEALALYTGTRNFHNYTIQKSFRDPSAKRLIKSFKISRDPVIINGTEWLSLKVHGQSFMMHQIRKMVAMVAMMVRCGGDIQRIVETYGEQKIAIPKAPGLGLLLERPIFDSYNKRTVVDYGKNPIDFSKFETEMEEFKQREIYERIFREEEESNAFGNFFNHIDTFQENSFMYVTSGGIAASKPTKTGPAQMSDKAALEQIESEPEDEVVNNGEEGG